MLVPVQVYFNFVLSVCVHVHVHVCVCVCAWMCGVQVCPSVYAVMVRVCAYRCVVRVSVHASHAEMFCFMKSVRSDNAPCTE